MSKEIIGDINSSDSIHRNDENEGRGSQTFFTNKPVKIGDIIDVTVIGISRRGDGLTRIDGYVIFIPNTDRGSNVRIRITELMPTYALSEIV
mgnify:CR=1 FL=1